LQALNWLYKTHIVMKKNPKILIIITGLLMVCISCTEDFVNLSNPNDHTTGSFWKTEDDALRGVNSVYMALYYDGLYMRLYPWLMDVRADDMRNTSPWWITDLTNYVTSPDNPCYINTWDGCYKGIFWANQVLTNVPDIEMENDLKTRILAEAKFLRGLYYYHLVIAYRNIPVVTTLPANSDEFFPAQATPEEAWAQVISDLSDALVLPVKEDYEDEDLGRATRGAAAGFLAKSYMINRQWSDAEPILKAIIDGEYGSYSLVENYRDNFTEANEFNEESLFEVNFERGVGGTTLGWVGDPQPDWSKTSGKARTYAPLGGSGYGDITPTDWIYNEFMEEATTDDGVDPRAMASMFFDYPGSMVYGRSFASSGVPNYVHVRKYLNDETSANETEWRSGINERILRYSDILLLYAECLNELNRTAEAYPFIQEVRDRASLPNLATARPGMSQEQMREQLDHERALEFCFEAQRYVDLVRWGYFDDPDKVEMLIERDPEYGNWTDGREYLAIPPTEVDVNSNLVQNEGW